MDEGLQDQTDAVLRALTHAQAVFGGAEPPADPPAFVARRDLEDDLGGGWY